MPYFRVQLERIELVDIVVEASDREELDRAIEAEGNEGFANWGMDESSWDSTVSPCSPNYDPKSDEADGGLHGLDLSDPEAPRIVAYCDRKDAPPETDEERTAREAEEAEEAGQQVLPV